MQLPNHKPTPSGRLLGNLAPAHVVSNFGIVRSMLAAERGISGPCLRPGAWMRREVSSRALSAPLLQR